MNPKRKKLTKILFISLMIVLFNFVFLSSASSPQQEKKMKKTKRSVVIGKRGVVATSQPLAALAGLDILKKGGNAVDAAVATAAVLNVVEPMSTGIGGDAFILIYLANEKKLLALNASGRAPYNLNRDIVLEKGNKRMPGSGNINSNGSRSI